MATPNYGYEKRQRELAKKKKKEDKLRAKASDRRPDQGGYAPQSDSQHPQSQQSQPPQGQHPDGATGTAALSPITLEAIQSHKESLVPRKSA